ncbi:MAG TPA: YdbC family protein [Anaerolineales bacterium]|nr:YdbC family protein [Anaerolineales bacterium]
MSDIRYEIVMQLGVLSQSGSGWTKEVNLISWNDRPPKYDIRDWSADHSQMGRGVTLSREELLALRDLLNQWDL